MKKHAKNIGSGLKPDPTKLKDIHLLIPYTKYEFLAEESARRGIQVTSEL